MLSIIKKIITKDSQPKVIPIIEIEDQDKFVFNIYCSKFFKAKVIFLGIDLNEAVGFEKPYKFQEVRPLGEDACYHYLSKHDAFVIYQRVKLHNELKLQKNNKEKTK